MHFRMSIGGEDVPAASGQTFDVTNPATGEVVADVAKGGPEDVDRAARAAQTAFTDGRWAGMSATDRGRALLDRHAETRPATEADYKRLNGVLAEKWPRFWYRLDFDVSELPSLLRVSYKSPLWEELGRRCLSCGSCTNVCPTCYCFNVQDEVDFALSLGKRTRVWDSCQLDEFATVAGGHNFRPARAARQRHRFLRKGQYQADAYGLLGCVGCGRCGQACLAKINPVDTFNALYHERVDARHAARNSLT